MPKQLPDHALPELADGQELVVTSSRPLRIVSTNRALTKRRLQASGTYVEAPPPPPPPPTTGGWETRPKFMERPASNVLRFTSNAQLETAFPGKVIAGRSFKDQIGNNVVSIRLENCSGFRILDCDFENTTEPIFLHHCTDFELGWLRARNIVGPYQRNDTHRGNLVQMDDCHRYDVHHFKVKGGNTEDVISQFASGGDASKMSRVRDFAIDLTGWVSPSGTGVIIGDNGGGYTEVCNGTMVNPGQVGQQIIDGPNILVHDLLIYSDRNHPKPLGDTGITTYGGDPKVAIWNVKVDWTMTNGQRNGKWWGAGTVTDRGGNNFDYRFSAAELAAMAVVL